jgi:hypothetical protein
MKLAFAVTIAFLFLPPLSLSPAAAAESVPGQSAAFAAPPAPATAPAACDGVLRTSTANAFTWAAVVTPPDRTTPVDPTDCNACCDQSVSCTTRCITNDVNCDYELSPIDCRVAYQACMGSCLTCEGCWCGPGGHCNDSDGDGIFEPSQGECD